MTEEDLLSTPANYATQEQRNATRELAQYLMKSGAPPPIGHPLQGIAMVLNQLRGSKLFDQTGADERSMLGDAARVGSGMDPTDPSNVSKALLAPQPAASIPGAPPNKKVAGADPSLLPFSEGQPDAPSKADDSLNPRNWLGWETDTPTGRVGGTFDALKTPEARPPPMEGSPATWKSGKLVEVPTDLSTVAPGTFGTSPSTFSTRALAFNGEPVDPGMPAMGSPRATALALAGKPAAVQPPGPGLGITTKVGDPSPEGALTGPLPHRLTISREQLFKVLANPMASPEIKKMATEAYYQQRQPLEVAGTGGTWIVDPNNPRNARWRPDLQKGTLKAGDIETQTFGGLQPDQTYKSFGGLGQGNSTQPDSGGLPAGIKKMYQEGTDLKADRDAAEELAKKSSESYVKLNDQISSSGREAAISQPLIEKALRIVESPKFYSGIGSDAVLAFKKLESVFGKDAAAAGQMELFKKIISGQQLSELKAKLQGLGQVRNMEMALVDKASANLDNTKAANRAVLDVTFRTQKLMMDLAAVAQEYSRSSPRPTNAGLQAVLQRHIDAHPMYTPQEVKDYEKALQPNPAYGAKPVPTISYPKNGPPQAPSGLGAELPPGAVLDK